jgi:hypothetical protein
MTLDSINEGAEDKSTGNVVTNRLESVSKYQPEKS